MVTEYRYRVIKLGMFAGNLVYYLLAVPMAFLFKDRRAFCEVACPVAVVMKVPASVSLINIKPSGIKCSRCGQCNRHCPVDVDVMGYISRGKRVRDTECVFCMECKIVRPTGAIK